LAYGLFAPWRLGPHILPPAARHAAKRILRRGTSKETEPLRTGFAGDDYIRMLAAERVTNIQCCPYNPYHEVYAGKAAERRILVPAYRLHHAVRKWFTKPSAKTAEPIASCLLLAFRKAG
jgi:hypothetical protein